LDLDNLIIMSRLFSKPGLAKYLQKQVEGHSRLNIFQLDHLSALRERYASKEDLREGVTKTDFGIETFGDLKELTGKKKSEVSYDELVDLLRIGNITLVDVREPAELQTTGSMPQAINIPLNQLKNVLSCDEQENPNEDVFCDKHAVVFCGLGNVKSITALEIARKHGLKNVRYYPGGYKEWVQEAAKLITAEGNSDFKE